VRLLLFEARAEQATGGGGRSAPDPEQERLLLFEARAKQATGGGGPQAPPTRMKLSKH